MAEKQASVFVVDDDEAVRKSLERLLRSAGYRARVFGSAEEYLASPLEDGPACLLLDLQMPGLGGLDLQKALSELGRHLPIVFITGHGDVPTSVKAMKAGAMDFLPKPFDDRALFEAIRQAIEKSLRASRENDEKRALEDRLRLLTRREREVFALVAEGKPNKRIALDLGTSEKTVKVHRGRVMKKLGAASLADLVRLAEKTGIPPKRT